MEINEVKKGVFARLNSSISGSRVFKAGTIVRLNADRNDWDVKCGRLPNGGFETLEGRKYGGYENISLKKFTLLSEEDIANMNKPSNIIITIGMDTFGRFPNMDKANEAIQLALQKNPAGQYNVYELKGAIRAKEVPVEFISSGAL